ncbi:MAG: Kdo hydroxylase family protein [Pyrinomonadaceae bacterium]
MSVELFQARDARTNMSWITVKDYARPHGWTLSPDDATARARWYCEQLERGEIIFFDRIPFDLPEEDQRFLLAQRRGDSRIHKNVSYRPAQDVLRGFSSAQTEDVPRLRRVMRRYSTEVTRFLSVFLAPYAGQWSLDFASYRPLEEEGRDLSLHKRNDLLHVDAFPSRPTGGGRILRVFTNINPREARIWHSTDSFDQLARRFASDAGLEQIAARSSSGLGSLRRGATRLMRNFGLPVAERSAYDRFMLRFHDYLKENADFQNNCPKIRLEFPPRATWIVFTDAVPHAVLSGQYALEQTYIVPPAALLSPDKSPISILESLCGRSLST